MIRAALGLFVLALNVVGSFGQLSDVKTPVEKRLDTYLKKAASEDGFSGAVVVAKGRKVLLSSGYGWKDRQKTWPVERDTKFYIASITKQFTAAAILKLEEQGKLSVTDRISKYLDKVPEHKKPITIHQLLTHTAGIEQNYAADGITDRAEAAKSILEASWSKKPGEKFGYSNDAYNLLAILVEIVSGQPYEFFLREQLLRPAGMSKNTGFWGERLEAGGKPIAEMLPDAPATAPVANWGFRGATGMSSTADDLYKWQQALFANKILAKASKEKLLRPYTQTSRGKYSYGWFKTDRERLGEEIWTAGSESFGHNAILRTYPDQTVIIVVSNAGQISGRLARDVVSEELETILFDISRN